jgi:regulatory protein
VVLFVPRLFLFLGNDQNMGNITAISPQQHNKQRVSVYVDGAFVCGLALETAAHLTVGQTLTVADIEELQAADAIAQGRQKAYRFLSYRPRSVAEMHRYLAAKEIAEPVIIQLIDYFTEQQLLDDHAFARYWVEQRETFKPRSSFALRQELRQKGISAHIIDAALAGLDEQQAARKAALKKVRLWANLPREQFRQKAGSFLQRRGFSYQVIEPVISELWEMVANDSVIAPDNIT